MENRKQITEFVRAAHKVAEHGLALCGSGNLSWRVSGGRMLVTTTRSWMARLSAADVAVCRITDGACLNHRNPSKEVGFHAGILRERPEVNVVLHYQSPSATAIACRKPQVKSFAIIPEIPHYIGTVGVVPYLTPGTRQLADAVTRAMRTHDLVILRNHGQVIVGSDFDDAIEKAVYFELACRIIIETGGHVELLSNAAVADLRRGHR
jgi:ribulose-5-phosphate 4-epimerase/fuculose-1-phosphate aldolase